MNTVRHQVWLGCGLFAALAAQSLSSAQTLAAEKTGRIAGQWSARASYLGQGLHVFDGPIELKVKRVQSPTGAYAAVFQDFDLFVEKGGRRLEGEREWAFSTLSEVLWAPDSKAFAITGSEGGWVGSWDVEVFYLREQTVRRANITSRVKRDAMRRYQCTDPGGNEEPNMGAIGWLDGSSRLLLAAEVPPHSSCPEMGKLMGYVVTVPTGQILERLSEGQLRRRWRASLGERLRTNADD